MSPPSLFLSCCTYSMEPTFWTLWNLEDGSYSNLHFGTPKMYSKKNLLYSENVCGGFLYRLNFDFEATGFSLFYIYEHACLPVSRFQETETSNVLCFRNFYIYKTLYLKRECHEIFDTFLSKNSTWAPIWTGKNGLAKLLVFTSIFAKTCVRVVNNFADTMLAWSMTSLTLCQRSQRLHRHRVSVVNYYAVTVSA